MVPRPGTGDTAVIKNLDPRVNVVAQRWVGGWRKVWLKRMLRR